MQTISKSATTPNNIVIVGGGAGGLELATKLGKKLGRKSKAKITLIDKHRVHIWKPLLHEVATGSLDTEIDGVVYRAHAKKHHYEFQLGSLVHIDREQKRLSLAPIYDDDGLLVIDQREIQYDLLVLSIGSVSNDFGTPGVAEHCSMLDSKSQAQRFQQKLLNLMLKKSAHENSEALKLAIVGAGATGVELSAELNHVVDVVSVYDRNANEKGRKLHIDLVEAGPRILPALPERIASAAQSELEKLGVTVHTNKRIIEATRQGYTDSDNNLIEADLMVWAAGVKAESWLSDCGFETNRINQIVCQPTLISESDADVYVIGDCCHVEMQDGAKVPPRAQAAHQMASVVAKNIVRRHEGKEPIEFVYRDYGSLVNLSRFSTVGSLMGNLMKGSMFIEGKIARLMYLSLYRMHQMAIHGVVKGPFIVLLSQISKIIRPKIKLH